MKLFVALLWLVAASSIPAMGADWPARPVRIVVPYAAGGQSDVVARLLAEFLTARFGQPFYIENQGGAGGAIAAKSVARAEPDGYTLMITGLGTHVLAPAMNRNIGFDPMRDFTHIAYIGGSPNVFVVHPSAGVKAFPEFVAWAKEAKGGVEYVSPGIGSGGNAVAEYFATKAGLKFVHVPHRGGGTAIGDLIAGHVKMGSITWATAREHVAVGNLVLLATSSAERIAEVPGAPTLKELGYPDIVSNTWLSVSGPRGLPDDLVARLNAEVNRGLQEPRVRKPLEQDAFDIKLMTPTEVTQLMQGEIDKWVPALRQALKVE